MNMTSPPVPAISMIVPVYNVQDHVADCIASLRAQTWADFEVIVVDDGSTDDSPARLLAAIAGDSRFQVLRQDNRGLSGARNIGLDHARAPVIGFVDSDDRLDPQFLTLMYGALTASDADWVACGIRFVHSDGTSTDHLAIHDTRTSTADHAAHLAPRLWPLTDWRDTIQHFPSAWNKLYRRALIDGLRFDEGTYFEDHAFFNRAAARTKTLLHLPQPLYLHTRDRTGQITAEDSDRVFEQLTVLDTVAGIICPPSGITADDLNRLTKTGAAEGFEKLSSRLIFERSAALHTPERRARFAKAAAAFLTRYGLRYDARRDTTLSPAWGLEMQGHCPLSVIVPWSSRSDLTCDLLQATLITLARQNLPGFEVLIVTDTESDTQRATTLAATAGLRRVRVLTGPKQVGNRASSRGKGAAQNHGLDQGLDQACGVLVVILEPGDTLRHNALYHWTDTMLREQADLGVSQFNAGLNAPHVHSGFFDRHGIEQARLRDGRIDLSGAEALCLHPRSSNKIYRRAFVIAAHLRFGTGVLADWPMPLGAALLSQNSLYFAHPWADTPEAYDALRLWHTPVSALRLTRALGDLNHRLPEAARTRLPPGWAKRLRARAAWEKLHYQTPDQTRFATRMAVQLLKRGQRRAQGLPPATAPSVIPNAAPRITAIASQTVARNNPDTDARTPAPMVQKDTTMLTFPTTGPARFSCRAVFSDHSFANISFFDRSCADILFHMSLRTPTDGANGSDGVAVFNRRGPRGWKREIHKPIVLPPQGCQVEIRFDASQVSVLLDETEVFHTTAGWTSRVLPQISTPAFLRPFPRLDEIGFVDFQGGFIVASIDIDLRDTAETAEAPLALNQRLELRGVLPTAQADQLRLECPGLEAPLPVITRPAGVGQHSLRAVLPGRAWQDVGPDDPLDIRLYQGDNATPLTQITLSRDDLFHRINRVVQIADLRSDPFCAAQVLEHVRFADLLSRFSPPTQAKLAHLAAFYDLEGYLNSAGAAPNSGPDLPLPVDTNTEPQQVHDALQQVTAALMADENGNGAAAQTALNSLSLPPEAASRLFLALSEMFSLRHQFETLTNWADRIRLPAFDPEPGNSPYSAWYNSAILPDLFLHGRMSELQEVLRRLTQPQPHNSPVWLVTPALAWVALRAVSANKLKKPARDALALGFADFLDSCAPSYWGRAPCHALIGATATLLVSGPQYLSAPVNTRLRQTALRAYGLSRQFWTQLAPEGDLPNALQTEPGPELAAAQEAFATVARSLDLAPEHPDHPDPSALVTALDGFSRAQVIDAQRFRRELLGPSGMALAPGNNPTAATLDQLSTDPDEAALRHLAFPGSPDPNPELAVLTAQALPRFYNTVPRSPHAALLDQTTRRISALLSRADTNIDPAEITALLPDLTTLAHPDAGYVGAGLAVGFLGGLINRNAPAQEVAEQAFSLVQSLILPPDSPLHAAMVAAPALRMALAALPQEHPLTQRALALVPGADLPALPVTSDLSPPLSPAPLFGAIVTVFSCLPYLDTRIPALRAGWLADLKRLGIPYVIVVGGGDGTLRGDVLHLDAPDDYEGLPQKTLETIAWCHAHTNATHMVKIDDDCFLNVEGFFQSYTYRQFDYYGRVLHRGVGQMDRGWHSAKSTSPRGRGELDKSPEPSTYADGGSGYALSRTAMAAVLDARHSPEGQYLIQLSFMEDKLLGDLLSLRGIHPRQDEYHISIRRRVATTPDARPVSLWVNSFDVSRAAPVKLVHTDTHTTQAAASETLTTTRLTPSKIWPSYQDLQLGYQSNALELISPLSRLEAARDAPVSVVSCMRNEMFMLPHFLAHYRALGVESFLVADNCSDDGTLEFLADQPDVALFSVDTDYNLSHYGVAWQQALMAAFRVNQWSLVADADELLVWQHPTPTRKSRPQSETLAALLHRPEFVDAEAVRLFMLDLYPRGPLDAVDFASGDPFGETGFVDRVPFLNTWPGRGPYSNMPTWTSALRHRLIAGSRPDLFVAQKLALLKYRPWMRFSAGLHYASDLRIADRELLFGHFKYNADFRRKAAAEVGRRQHFNDAEEYRKYLAILSEGRDVIFDPSVSIPWTDSRFVGARLQFS